MKIPFKPSRAAALLLACASPLALTTMTGSALAQGPGYGNCPPAFMPSCPPGGVQLSPVQPNTTNPSGTTPNPTTPNTPNPNTTAPDNTTQPALDTTGQNPDVSLNNEGSGARGGETVALSPGGYVDDAIPQTLFRLRYEARYGFNEFDRAQYQYATWRELGFHNHALLKNGTPQGVFVDPSARGSQIFAGNLDDQIASSYLEVAFSKRFSAFADVPFRFVHFRNILEEGDEPHQGAVAAAENRRFPERGEAFPFKQDTAGISDLDAGFKYALIADPNCRYLTFQLRTYIPTGDSGLGLGTGHWSVEPGLLLYQRLSDRLVLQGEFKDWIPIASGPGGGNVLSYGAGLGYDVIQRCNFRVTPVAEFVGWTVLGGTEADNGPIPGSGLAPDGVDVVNVGGVVLPGDHGATDASGQTIVNAKLGVRTYFGQNSDVYAGYGHSLTGDRWYKDEVRVEYRLHF